MPTTSTLSARHSLALPRAVGFVGCTAILVGTTIGSGIFLVPHDVAQDVGSVAAMMAVWVVGGVLSLTAALTLAELGAALPEAGGIYVYLREAYGKLLAFLFGWAALVVIESGGVATLAVAFGIYTASFVPLSALGQKLVAAGVIWLLTAVNFTGVRRAARVQTVFTVAKICGLAVIIGAALFPRHVTPVFSSQALPTAHTTFGSFGLALIGALWAYHGWHHLANAAGEAKDPATTLPRSFILGTILVIALYLSANLAYLRVLPLNTMARSEFQRVAAQTMLALWGGRGAAFVSALILCSIFGGLNGNILGGARSLYAMARDRVFFAPVAWIHPRYETPYVALLIQGAWSTVLALTGSFRQLYTSVIFTGWIFYAAAMVGVIVLRHTRPELKQPYRTWGYPVVPLVFSGAAVLIVGNALVHSPRESGIGLGLVLLGIPIYWIWTRFQ